MDVLLSFFHPSVGEGDIGRICDFESLSYGALILKNARKGEGPSFHTWPARVLHNHGGEYVRGLSEVCIRLLCQLDVVNLRGGDGCQRGDKLSWVRYLSIGVSR